MEKKKKTYEFAQYTIDLINEISEFFDITRTEVIELAVNKPKIFIVITDLYNKIKKMD